MICKYLAGIALSAHLGVSEDLNEIHPQARVECGSYVSGIYYNSYEKPSIYAGFETQILKDHDLSVEYGIVDGYSMNHDKDIIPFVRFKYKYFFATPLIEDNGAVIGIEYFIGD